jgi:hypothetical protein
VQKKGRSLDSLLPSLHLLLSHTRTQTVLMDPDEAPLTIQSAPDLDADLLLSC